MILSKRLLKQTRPMLFFAWESTTPDEKGWRINKTSHRASGYQICVNYHFSDVECSAWASP